MKIILNVNFLVPPVLKRGFIIHRRGEEEKVVVREFVARNTGNYNMKKKSNFDCDQTFFG